MSDYYKPYPMLQKFTEQTYRNRYSCDGCGTALSAKFYEFHILHYCPTCFTSERIVDNILRQWDGACCHKKELRYVHVTTASKAKIVRQQCQSCGCVYSGSYKSGVSDIVPCNTGLKEVYESHHNRCNEERRKIQNEVLPALKKKAEEYRRGEYDNYLNSPQWKEKRLLVLERDKYVCQSCLLFRATDVHHLDYKFFRNEPLFTLISVCRKCHEAIEAMKRDKDSETIIHK